MSVRSFLAVELGAALQSEVFQFTEPLRCQIRDMRWVKEENLHLTLRFLGDVEESKLESMAKLLKETLSTFSCFELRPGTLGGFPKLAACRVLWLGLEKGKEACGRLKHLVDGQLVHLGFSKEPETFVPHITLARSKKGAVDVASHMDQAMIFPEAAPGSRIENLTCFKSILTPSGPVYERFFVSPFREGNDS